MCCTVSERAVLCIGKHGLPLSAVVRFIKWSYCYQQWDFFDFWLPRAMAAAEV